MRTTQFAVALAVTLLLAGGASAQERHDGQFNDHDRQVTQSWYSQHRDRAPAGLRDQDRLPVDQEQHLRSGEAYDRNMERHSHSVPRELSRQLSPAPRYHKYVAIGGHVALVDTKHHLVRDVIRLSIDDNEHRH